MNTAVVTRVNADSVRVLGGLEPTNPGFARITSGPAMTYPYACLVDLIAQVAVEICEAVFGGDSPTQS
jgi:hypothetical protein